MKRYLTLIIILLSFTLNSESFYVLKKGDTLYSVSRKHNVAVGELISANKIKDPQKIKIGTKLLIPGKKEKIVKKELIKHKIKKGETLYKLCRDYKISLKDLLKVNKLTEKDIIKPGDILRIPSNNKIKSETKLVKYNTKKYPKFFWPHNGYRTKADGKLQGNYFEGKKGDPIYSVSSGKVIWVAPYRGYKKIILVESPDSYIYVYGGNDNTNINVGDSVIPGDKIGELGLNIHEKKPLLFFSVFKNNLYINTELAPRG